MTFFSALILLLKCAIYFIEQKIYYIFPCQHFWVFPIQSALAGRNFPCPPSILPTLPFLLSLHFLWESFPDSVKEKQSLNSQVKDFVSASLMAVVSVIWIHTCLLPRGGAFERNYPICCSFLSRYHPVQVGHREAPHRMVGSNGLMVC